MRSGRGRRRRSKSLSLVSFFLYIVKMKEIDEGGEAVLLMAGGVCCYCFNSFLCLFRMTR